MKLFLNSKKSVYDILDLAIRMKAISGLALLNALIKRIQLSRLIFLTYIELGSEAFIPKDLS